MLPMPRTKLQPRRARIISPICAGDASNDLHRAVLPFAGDAAGGQQRARHGHHHGDDARHDGIGRAQLRVEPVADLQIDAAGRSQPSFLLLPGQPHLQGAGDVAFQDARRIGIGGVHVQSGDGRPCGGARQVLHEILAAPRRCRAPGRRRARSRRRACWRRAAPTGRAMRPSPGSGRAPLVPAHRPPARRAYGWRRRKCRSRAPAAGPAASGTRSAWRTDRAPRASFPCAAGRAGAWRRGSCGLAPCGILIDQGDEGVFQSGLWQRR